MKKLLAIIALAALAVTARAQTAVTTLIFVGTNPTFTPSGSLVSANISANFNSTITVDGTPYTSVKPVSWDGTDKTRSVTVDGITATYEQVTLLAAAIANKEFAGGDGTQKKAAADKAAADAAAAKAATTTATP